MESGLFIMTSEGRGCRRRTSSTIHSRDGLRTAGTGQGSLRTKDLNLTLRARATILCLTLLGISKFLQRRCRTIPLLLPSNPFPFPSNPLPFHSSRWVAASSSTFLNMVPFQARRSRQLHRIKVSFFPSS